MAYGKKLCFVVNVCTGTKYTVSLGKLYNLCNVATVVYRVTTEVYTIKSYFFYQSNFFPIMWCISFVRDNETCISVLWARPAPYAIRISCRSLLKLKLALWKRNTKENKSIGVSRDTAVILQQVNRRS
jgi:hypothetical protein